jgi:hypothetical protein
MVMAVSFALLWRLGGLRAELVLPVALSRSRPDGICESSVLVIDRCY